MAEPTKQEMPARNRKRLWLYLLLLFLLLNWDYPHNQIYYYYKCKNESGDRIYDSVSSDAVLVFDYLPAECTFRCMTVLSSGAVRFVEVLSLEVLPDQRNYEYLNSLLSNKTAYISRYSSVDAESEFCRDKEIRNSFDDFKSHPEKAFEYCLKKSVSYELSSAFAIENVRTIQRPFLRVTKLGYRIFSLADDRTISSSYEFRLWPTGLNGILSRNLPVQLQEVKSCGRSAYEDGRLTNDWLIQPFAPNEQTETPNSGGEV